VLKTIPFLMSLARRAKLIKKGMVFSTAHGEMAFTVPLFDAFMLRAMPELSLPPPEQG